MKGMLVPLLAVALACGLLSGCYESPSVTLYEPGVYKGAKDPLLSRLQTPKLQQQLEERLRAVQTDR